MNIDNTNHSSSVVPRPIPAPSEPDRWNISDPLSPSSSTPNYSRDHKMSLDFAAKASQSHHGLYGQPDLDQPFNIPNSENVSVYLSPHFP